MSGMKGNGNKDFFIVLQHRVIANVSITLAYVGAKDGSCAYELIVDGVLHEVGTKKSCKAAWSKHIRRLNSQKAKQKGVVK